MRFLDSLKAKYNNGAVPVIPDFKPVSPKYGDLFAGRDPVSIAVYLESLGAPAISVVTESKHFGGSMSLLETISARVKVPVLRKDFITTPKDVEDSKNAGARAVLLICSRLEKAQVKELYCAAVEMGIQPLVEVHTSGEMGLAAGIDAPIIGINNKNILDLERDGGTVATTQNLITLAPRDAFIISESGIKSPADVRQAVEAGAHAVLVGTALWQAKDMGEMYKSLGGANEG